MEVLARGLESAKRLEEEITKLTEDTPELSSHLGLLIDTQLVQSVLSDVLTSQSTTVDAVPVLSFEDQQIESLQTSLLEAQRKTAVVPKM